MDSWPYSRERSRSVAFRNSTVAPSGRQKEWGLLTLGAQPQALGAGQGTGRGGDLRAGGLPRGHLGMSGLHHLLLWPRLLGCVGTRLHGRE